MRHGLLLAAIVALGIGGAAAPPVAQDPLFHVMADQRSFAGLPHALNMLSNVPFAVVGLAGLVLIARRGGADTRMFRDDWTRWPYAVLFGGTALVAVGSSYYHLEPNNSSLLWDRLPIAVGFAGLLVAILAERVSVPAARVLLLPVVTLAVASVGFWYWTELAGRGDLRLYGVVQFGSLLLVALMLVLYPRHDRGTVYLTCGLLAYGAAKVFELTDGAVFALGQVVSGHTMKHLAAAAGVGCVAAMLRARTRPACWN